MIRDLRHGVRVLFQARGWTAVIVVSLALGIGARASRVDPMVALHAE